MPAGPAEYVPRSKYKELPLSELSPEDMKKAEWSAYMVERRKKRDKSIPPWANKTAIREIYIKARQLTVTTGVKHEVDHIIPSNHKLVCGLHVENNLQILTESENIKKSNSFVVV
jgi:5-methylcytosine-specific restriction endonuclease McrA